ncbi:hypothetical protein DET0586 [Dehalococcoides mccartyi 195]|uniref:Uncharacterized protein n=1 Tax=Dehalococcoides mccartyi (strain ATCC BAA-2266 / KCTC 15142 / 195) TaxID=243164 RepID=Q3Z8X1_DEHM1|nr:hypothetical protein DET0586 [Dehalococcoides mccartyi 195]
MPEITYRVNKKRLKNTGCNRKTSRRLHPARILHPEYLPRLANQRGFFIPCS